jgi:hypothetical protein
MEIQNLPDMKKLDLMQQTDERMGRRTFIKRLCTLGFLSLASATAVFRGLIMKRSYPVRKGPNGVEVDNEESLPSPFASSETYPVKKSERGGWIILREARYYKKVEN